MEHLLISPGLLPDSSGVGSKPLFSSRTRLKAGTQPTSLQPLEETRNSSVDHGNINYSKAKTLLFLLGD